MPAGSPRRALISVSDKTGLAPFAKRLVELGFEILSTGGTSRFLQEQGLPVGDVSDYTGFPEMMDGRVKTLHPKIHAAILGRPDLPGDRAAMAEHGVVPFELVVINLYPFEQTVARPGVTPAEAIENIDIGGPSMIRSAAKNHASVAIVTQAAQYEPVLAALDDGAIPPDMRRLLAAAAFEMTARYDRAIADWFAQMAPTDPSSLEFPEQLSLRFVRQEQLRYGENPHQSAAVYADARPSASALTAAEKLHGKELSYNNLLDLDAARGIVSEFSDPAAVIIKHNNPCGCAIAATLAAAFEAAHAGDPVSAFGSIVGFNRVVDVAVAEQLCLPDRFIEAILAPGFEPAALEMLTTRPKWRNNVRLLQLPALGRESMAAMEYRSISGGLLVQQRDDQPDPRDEWKVVSRRAPNADEQRDLAFAWYVCKHVKSNAIVLARQGGLVGVGAGQMSRLDSAGIAVRKAGERARGAVVASDAFFPFRDSVDELARAGVRAVIQPGGSRGDESVIAAANEHDIAMIFTGRRHFKH